ncbi:MAG: 3-hydroxyacyl-CoA dehydrogenase NAD-binding domain-containing protein [Myxococcota bacterium]|nr:3-hydroxyacyl-CoA dehydrogenase NAD-binding domain-containing protein [Myxococcota bacterium]
MISSVAVVGAGNMGSGIAQKIATEGFPVILVDSDLQRAEQGKARIAKLLAEGVERKIFKPDQVDAILSRVTPAGELQALADVDLVIEAIFEDIDVKRSLFAELSKVCRPEAILATNTSSFLVADVAEAVDKADRVVGLHYFFHPAKNRLVEVIGHQGTSADTLRTAWAFQEQIGKTPIDSADAPGFVVNRFFVPWLNEAVRLHEEGHTIAEIEAVSKTSFGIGMGPFELMNVTGVPITLHASASLAERLGDFYAPAASLKPHVDSGVPWDLSGDVTGAGDAVILARLWGVVYHVACQLVSEGVSTPEDTDIGARVGLRWPAGPFERFNEMGLKQAASYAQNLAKRYSLQDPTLLAEQVATGSGFSLKRVVTSIEGKTAYITINRPDKLNALDPETVSQLAACFDSAAADEAVTGIVIRGAGKAFVAGADVQFFVDKIRAERLSDIVEFTTDGQELFKRIEACAKPVVCLLDGLALGGGGELALSCHRIVATHKASMAFPETGIGIYPGLGGTQRLTRRLGVGLARYYIYTGAAMRAKDLAQLGIAHQLVGPNETAEAVTKALGASERQPSVAQEVLSESQKALAKFLEGHDAHAIVSGDVEAPEELSGLKLQKKIGFKAPIAVRLTQELTAIAGQGDLVAGLDAELAHLEEIFGSKDALEGLSALLERRRPSFTDN